MADVTLGLPDGDGLFSEGADGTDRGQLLLVAGLVMAVSLVVLVVLLNSTIYSENVATRGIESADGEALEVRATAVGGTGELLDATNRAGPAGYDEAAETVRDGIADLDQEMARSYAERGGVARVELVAIDNGSRIDTPLAAADPNSSRLARDIDRTRGFVFDAERDSLAVTNAADADTDAFHVSLNESTGGSRQVYVYNGSDGNVTVAVGDNSTQPSALCSVPPDGRDRVAVDFTEERLGSQPCPGMWPSSLVTPADPYTIELINASAADGDVTVTARPNAGENVTTDLTAARQPAAYEATINLWYRTADLRFETAVRVAPGEPDA